MKRAANRVLAVIGILSLVGAPFCFISAAAYAYFQPRLYSATTGFQLLFPGVDGPRLHDAFQKAQQRYPARMQKPLTSRVSLEQSVAPDQFRLSAIDTDPLAALNTANTLTVLVTEALNDASKEEGRRVNLLERAEMPRAPAFPNVRRIMTVGLSAGLMCAFVGIISLVIANMDRAGSVSDA